MKLRSRILLVGLALSAAVVIPTGLISWKFLSGALEAEFARSLDRETTLLMIRIQEPLPGAAAESVAIASLRQFSVTLDRRVTLVSAAGRTLFDSDTAFADARSEAPELQRALRTGRSTTRRPESSAGGEYLYVARKIPDTAPAALRGGVIRLGMSMARVSEEEKTLSTMLAAVGFALLACVVAITIPLSGWITGKIVHIGHTARMIAGGALSERARVDSGDELGGLASALNDMAEKLQQDIAKLQKLELVRSEFLGNVSHELRTPIFAIQGFMETLLDGAIDDPAVNRDFLEKAHRHAERLNTLLRDLIEISRIESGEMKMSFRYVPIKPILRQILEDMRPEAEKKKMSLSIAESADESVEVFADRDRIRQALVNLVDNAIKYTDPGGRVTIGVRRISGVCEISVTDTGCGIAAEHIPRLFERFYRVDRDRSREVGGTGLGLAIVKHIVEAHGGKLRVDSVVGEGSTFAFTLKF